METKNTQSLITGIVILFLASLPVSAATLHVGTGQTYSTIDAAVAVMQSNDEIVIHAGTYDMDNLDGISNPLTGVTFRRNENDKVVINGTGNSGAGRVGIYGHDDFTFQGLIFRNDDSIGGGAVVLANDASGHTFENCVFWSDDGNGLVAGIKNASGDYADVTIDNCTFFQNSDGSGLFSEGTAGNTGWTVKDSIFLDSKWFGAYARSDAYTVNNSAFWSNGNSNGGGDVGGVASLGTGNLTSVDILFASTDISDPDFLYLPEDAPTSLTQGASDGGFIGAFGVVPEPTSLALFGAGALACLRRRTRK